VHRSRFSCRREPPLLCRRLFMIDGIGALRSPGLRPCDASGRSTPSISTRLMPADVRSRASSKNRRPPSPGKLREVRYLSIASWTAC
jgi:hypothetical protein